MMKSDAVSFVFAIFLGVYALLRLVLWARGQLRLRLRAQELPQLAQRSPAPPSLRPELARFFESCSTARCRLTQQRRQIARARITDPDEHFGFLRDARYRRAVIEANRGVRTWLRQNEVFFGLRRHRQRDWPVSPECAESTLQAMSAQLRLACHSRALEPFAIADVDDLDRSLACFIAKLERTMTALAKTTLVSYRSASLGSARASVSALHPPPVTEPLVSSS